MQSVSSKLNESRGNIHKNKPYFGLSKVFVSSAPKLGKKTWIWCVHMSIMSQDPSEYQHDLINGEKPIRVIFMS